MTVRASSANQHNQPSREADALFGAGYWYDESGSPLGAVQLHQEREPVGVCENRDEIPSHTATRQDKTAH